MSEIHVDAYFKKILLNTLKLKPGMPPGAMQSASRRNKRFAYQMAFFLQEMDMKKELRAYSFEIRAEDNEEHGKHITGRPIVCGRQTDLGNFDEIIDSGALLETDLKDVRFLVNHNTDMIPLARSRNNNKDSTMQMRIDENGMDIRVNLDTEGNTEARNLYSAVKRGDISGMSFMFTVEKDSWEKKSVDGRTRRLRHIEKIGKVFEVSAVTFPAYEQTEIQARGLTVLESTRDTLESVENREKAELESCLTVEHEERQRLLTLLSL